MVFSSVPRTLSLYRSSFGGGSSARSILWMAPSAPSLQPRRYSIATTRRRALTRTGSCANQPPRLLPSDDDEETCFSLFATAN